jgi:hypothetical protein
MVNRARKEKEKFLVRITGVTEAIVAKAVLITVVVAFCLVAGDVAIGRSAPGDEELPEMTVTAVGNETFKGKGTDKEFPRTVDVRLGDRAVTMVALGSGVRKKAFFKVYEAVSYAEESASLNASPYPALLGGSVATRIVMYFVRDVGAEKLQNAWRDGFEKYLPDVEPGSQMEMDQDTFVAFFAGTDIKRGQTIELTWIPDTGLFTSVVGQAQPPLADQKLASAVFSNWYGDKPISKDLKKDLVRFLSD